MCLFNLSELFPSLLTKQHCLASFSCQVPKSLEMRTCTAVQLNSLLLIPQIDCGSIGSTDFSGRNLVTQYFFTSSGLSLLSHHSVLILSGVGTAEWNVYTELGACPYEFRYVIYLTLSLTCYIILGKSHYIFELQFPDLKTERLGQDQKSRTQMPVVRATG